MCGHDRFLAHLESSSVGLFVASTASIILQLGFNCLSLLGIDQRNECRVGQHPGPHRKLVSSSQMRIGWIPFISLIGSVRVMGSNENIKYRASHVTAMKMWVRSEGVGPIYISAPRFLSFT